MGTKYSSVSISGYNTSPPSDDGTVTDANKVKWSYIKTKIGDPVKTAIESINTAFLNSVGSVASRSSNTQLASSNYDDVILTTSTFSQTFAGASTLGASWKCYIANVGTGVVTLTPNGSETINGASILKLHAGMGGMVISDGSNLNFISGKPTAAHKLVTTTRDNTVANGTQAVTGVGFKPRAVILFSSVSGTSAMSVGMSDGSGSQCMFDNYQNAANSYAVDSQYSVTALTGSSVLNQASVSSLDSDGFTLSWTKTGSPTGTTTIYALCFM